MISHTGIGMLLARVIESDEQLGARMVNMRTGSMEHIPEGLKPSCRVTGLYVLCPAGALAGFYLRGAVSDKWAPIEEDS